MTIEQLKEINEAQFRVLEAHLEKIETQLAYIVERQDNGN